jgi:phosphoglycolate phosphatase
MKTYGAAIFDMDGTLLDTLDDLGDCMNRVLAGSGYSGHPIEAYKHFVGDGMRKLAERVLPEGSRDEATIERISAEMVSEYGKRWAEKTALYPGIASLLDELARRGIRRAILSNKPHELTEVMARRYFGAWSFDPVFGARDGVPRKPDPAAALDICRRWGLEPGEVLYAGDTNTDMRTARKGGMFALGVLWGFRSREELLQYGAQALIAEPGQMLGFFRPL